MTRRYLGMTLTANRVLGALLAGAAVVVAVLLTLGLSGVELGGPAGSTAERAQVQAETAQAQAEAAYLDDLQSDASELWDMPFADGVDPDVALVNFGHLTCQSADEASTAGAGTSTWPMMSRLLTDRGFEQQNALAITVHANQNLCPAVG